MANRTRKNKRASEIDRTGSPSPLKLTRRGVARRELIAAIDTFFHSGDPVVVHLLAAACHDISVPVARAAGRKPMRDMFDEMVREEYRDSWKRIMKLPYNFFKHGGSDPDEELEYFNPKFNEVLLFEACQDFSIAFGDLPFCGTVYVAWYYASNPDMLTQPGREMMAPMLKEFEGMTSGGRYCHALTLLDVALSRDKQVVS